MRNSVFQKLPERIHFNQLLSLVLVSGSSQHADAGVTGTVQDKPAARGGGK